MRGVKVVAAMAALVGGAATAAPVDWRKAAPVRITVAGSHYVPDRVVLRAGRPYLLRVVNDTGQKHDLSSDAFFANATVAAGDRAKAVTGKLTVPAHGQVTVRLIAPHGAIYRFHCSRFGHDVAGEKGEFTVR